MRTGAGRLLVVAVVSYNRVLPGSRMNNLMRNRVVTLRHSNSRVLPGSRMNNLMRTRVVAVCGWRNRINRRCLTRRWIGASPPYARNRTGSGTVNVGHRIVDVARREKLVGKTLQSLGVAEGIVIPHM